MNLFCSNCWQNLHITAAVHYFHYNFHPHYHYHHIQYHCLMLLCRLRILLTIPLNCNIVIYLFQINFVFFLWHVFFSSIIPRFSFFTSSKRTQNLFATIRKILDVLFLLLFISIFIYIYLSILIYTYLFLLLFFLYYLLYELDKIVKIWGI